jgi:hypothetical protein
MLNNMNYQFPSSLVTDEAKLIDIFIDEAVRFGISHTDAENLFKRLPASVRSAPAVKFVLGPDWHYVFGKPFHLSGNSPGFGIPHQARLVISLVRASLVAEHALTPSQFRRFWWQQIDSPAKHLDAIVEMLAVANVTPDQCLTYEQEGLGVGSQRIDWLLKTKEDGNFLLEVKNRPGQMAQELMRIQTASRAVDAQSISDEPITDFDALFKSTSSKFLPIPDSSCTQGAVVFLGIKVPKAQFEDFFLDHLQVNLHFVALGKLDKEAGICVNLLATSLEIASRVLSAFKWREDADLTY